MDNGYAFYILQNVNVAISVEKNQFNTLVETKEKKNRERHSRSKRLHTE